MLAKDSIESSLSRVNKSLLIFLSAAIAVLVALYLMRVIRDPDFFWHLRTGEWIWQNKALPQKDPFLVRAAPENAAVISRQALSK